jgi:putative nucleotidyltransferase with HDIG domain
MYGQQIVLLETQGELLKKSIPELQAPHPAWNLAYFTEAPAAIAQVLRSQVRVVVGKFGTDRPGFQAFFAELIRADPTPTRIALVPDDSQTDLAAPMDLVHQCLRAGRPVSQLRLAIERGLTAWGRARKNPGLAAFIADLKELPSPPNAYFEIADELESPSGSTHGVARIIARDPAVVAKILRVANSGYFGFPRPIADLHEAVVLLGTDTVQALVLAAQIYARLATTGLDLEPLWSHSVAVSGLAREIALRAGGDRHTANFSGVGGLLHDLGQVILMCSAPERYLSLLRDAAGEETELLCREHEHFGLGHPEVGAYLLALWGLPLSVQDAVAHHHGWPDTTPRQPPLPMKAIYGAEWCLRGVELRRPEADSGLPEGRVERAVPPNLEQWRQEIDRMFDAGLLSPARK